MLSFLDTYRPQLEKIIESFKTDLMGLRANRATPALVENALIEAYDTKMPLKQLSTITAPDSKTILVEPWDKSLLKNIELGIFNTNLGLNPMNDGQCIRLNLPPLTEENKRNLVKVLNERYEQKRIALRLLRDEIKENIVDQERNKKLSQDTKFQLQKELDKMIGEYNERIKEIRDRKEKEIMMV